MMETPPKLSIELVPRSCWYQNVRSNVSENTWRQLKKITAKNARYHCEICHGRGPRWPVECHEVWHYDDARCIQQLERLIALCPPCHRVKHIGLSELKGKLPAATRHLAQVNQWSLEKASAYIDEKFAEWEARSKHAWILDITYLDQIV